MSSPSLQKHNITPLMGAAPVAADVVDITKAAGDKLRAQILQALAQDAFSVQELGDLFAMAQPAMSHHLKILHRAGLVTKRKEGTSHFYQRAFFQTTDTAHTPLIQAIFDALDAEVLPSEIAEAVHRIMAKRSEQSRAFFANQADALAQQTTLVCAPQVYTEAVMHAALSQPADKRTHALEIGPGAGVLLEAIAPHFDHVMGIDNAAEMLEPAELRSRGLPNVTLLEQDFSTLPNTPSFNLVVAAMVIHHMPAPLGFFQKAAEVLHSDGLLVIAELCQHDQEWVREACGDLRLGFTPEELAQWAQQAGLSRTQHHFLAQRNGFRVQVSAFARESQQP